MRVFQTATCSPEDLARRLAWLSSTSSSATSFSLNFTTKFVRKAKNVRRHTMKDFASRGEFGLKKYGLKLTKHSTAISGDLPGTWCGRCDGAQLTFTHDGAFDNRCFTSDDVYDIMDATDSWSYDECGANIKNDVYLTLVYGSEGFTNEECDNYC